MEAAFVAVGGGRAALGGAAAGNDWRRRRRRCACERRTAGLWGAAERPNADRVELRGDGGAEGGAPPPPPPPPPPPVNTRCGHVSLIGRSNIGKSTLMNRLVGEKVAIVTPKVQTTRSRIVGIAVRDNAQLIFLDTPGIFDAKVRLDRAMIDSAWSSAADSDVVTVMRDAQQWLKRGRSSVDDDILSRLSAIQRQHRSVRLLLLLNKVDLLTAAQCDEVAADFECDYAALQPLQKRCVRVSATRGDGVDVFVDALTTHLPRSPWLYPEDEITTMPMRLLAAEITREKIFLQLKEELPYSIAVDTLEWRALRDGSVRVEQEIFVQRQTQKAIVTGKGGRQIKAIGVAARADIEAMAGCRVHLFTHVKVRPDWKENRQHYSPWGLRYTS